MFRYVKLFIFLIYLAYIVKSNITMHYWHSHVYVSGIYSRDIVTNIIMWTSLYFLSSSEQLSEITRFRSSPTNYLARYQLRVTNWDCLRDDDGCNHPANGPIGFRRSFNCFPRYYAGRPITDKCRRDYLQLMWMSVGCTWIGSSEYGPRRGSG